MSREGLAELLGTPVEVERDRVRLASRGTVEEIAGRISERSVDPNFDDRQYADLLVRAARAGRITVAPRGSRAVYRWPSSA